MPQITPDTAYFNIGRESWTGFSRDNKIMNISVILNIGLV